MTERDHEHRKRFEELMRNAPQRMQDLNRRALARERLDLGRHYRKRAEARLEAGSEISRVVKRLDEEIARLLARFDALRAPEDIKERVDLTTELARWREVRRFYVEQMRGHGQPRRKPPESGLAVPVEPPKGPKPKLGGAEAPLDFG